MFYTGIDVASLKHDVAIVSDLGEVLVDHLTITNDQAGFLRLKNIIESCCREKNQMKIGMEETGIYPEEICDFLVTLGFAVYTINPILTSYSRKSASPRLTKTDAIDAIAIAKYLMINIGALHSYSPSLYYLHDIKTLSRIFRDKKDQIAKRKTELKRLIQIAFPEFLTRFNLFSEWSLLLFKDYPIPKQIAKIRISTLVQRIRTKSNRLLNAELLHSIASTSVGTTADSVLFLIRSTIDDLSYFGAQIHALKNRFGLTCIGFLLYLPSPVSARLPARPFLPRSEISVGFHQNPL
jgi:transposase